MSAVHDGTILNIFINMCTTGMLPKEIYISKIPPGGSNV